MLDVKIIFLVLLTVHLVVDFILLPLLKKDGTLLKVTLNIAVVYLLCLLSGNNLWKFAVVAGLCHFITAAGKKDSNNVIKWQIFLTSQVIQLTLLLIVSIVTVSTIKNLVVSPVLIAVCILLSGFILAVLFSGVLIGHVCVEFVSENKPEEKGLNNGGRRIGQLERLLIFIMILLNMPAGIGFLVAAKSIIRYGEINKDKKMAEYVLIGTLMSFTAAIIIGAMTRFLLSPHIEVLKELILIK
jgi:hypothetical protein